MVLGLWFEIIFINKIIIVLCYYSGMFSISVTSNQSCDMKNSVFSDNIKLVLDEIMSEGLLALRSGVNQSTISRIATGSSPNPYNKTKVSIAKALNLGVDYLGVVALLLSLTKFSKIR